MSRYFSKPRFIAFRFCDGCDKKFTPTGRQQRKCDNCKHPITRKKGVLS